MGQDKKKGFHINLENSTQPKLKKWLEIGLILLLVFVISIITLSDANPTTNSPGRDGGFFLYVGKALRSGAKLYEDIWDSKGPLIFWINALGVGNDYSRWGLYLIELVFFAASLFIAYWFIKKRYGFLPAISTIFLGAHLLKFVIGYGNYTEEYSILFSWIAIAALALLVNKKKPFWPFFLMGATAVLNFLLRANNIGTIIAVALVALIYVFLKQKEIKIWQPIAYLFIGALSIALPTSLYFIINGTFGAMIDASIFYNFAYSAVSGKAFSMSPTPAISAFNGWFYVFLALWFVGIAKLVLNFRQEKFDSFLLLTVLAFPIEYLMSSISGRGHGHYFICWIPACMLLISFGLSVIQEEAIKTSFRIKCETTYKELIIGLLLIIVVASSFMLVGRTVRYLLVNIIPPRTKHEYQDSASKVIEELTDETDKVLVFGGQAGINIMARRDSINAALFYPRINNSEIGLEVQKEFFENLKEEQPRLIIDGHRHVPNNVPAFDPQVRQSQTFTYEISENVEEVLAWINENYERYDEANDYIIYRLREKAD